MAKLCLGKCRKCGKLAQMLAMNDLSIGLPNERVLCQCSKCGELLVMMEDELADLSTNDAQPVRHADE